MSKENETLIDAALALDESLSPRLAAVVKKPDEAAGDVPNDATEVPDNRDLAADRPVKATGKEP